MDMMPPQAPPAHTQAVYQEASAAFDRIVGLQAWLAVEQANLPALPAPIGPASLAPFLLALDAYWDASRRADAARRIAAAARDLAVLSHHDGNLDEPSLAVIRAITSGNNVATGITVRELLFGQVAHAGSLIVQAESIPDRALVFSQDHGWESFPRLIDAHAELERRARRALVVTADLPGIARQDLATLGPDTFVSSREMVGDPFRALVERLVDVQHDKLRQAWFEHALADGDDARESNFADEAFDAVRLDQLFDVEALLAARHAALVETFNAERLERVPANVAADWREADDNYVAVQRSIAASDAATGWPAPMDLPAYAAYAIGERLAALGVTEDPADIQIRIDRSADLTARLDSLQSLFEGPAPEQIRLVDLAYQNIAIFDPVRLTASTSDGTPIAGLGDATLRRLVRGLDLSSRYRSYVDTTFRSGSDAAIRRDHATRLQAAHMRLLANEARLSYHLDDAPRSFLSDRAERGYLWVKAALDAPAASGRARIEAHDVVVRQITYLDTPLRDILSFGARQPESVGSIVLYTPGAPDGITFREFADRAEAGRKFFYQPAFREYLLDRLPADHARMLPNGHAREFAGDNLANWVLGSPADAAYTRTQAPFDEREVSGNFLAAAYEVDVQLGLRNAQVFMRSAEHANWTWLVQRMGTLSTRQLVEDAMKGVVTAPARAAQAAWRLYDSVKAGDQGQAFVDFADFYNASLSAALPVYTLGSTSAAHAITGARFRAAGRLVDAKPAVQPAVVFESRFIARDVHGAGQANRDGILTIQGKTYIEHGGQRYRVVHDSDYGTWRLSRPDASPTFRGPAIRRTSAGTWAYRRVGLRGGTGRGPGTTDRLPDLYDELQAEIELAFPDPLERELVATRMRFERVPPRDVSSPPPAVSTAQRTRWTDAVTQARIHKAARTIRRDGPFQGPPLELTGPGREPITGFREVRRVRAPTHLWYYGKKPYRDSDLIRHRDGPGFSMDMAELEPRLFAPGVHGVRLTTWGPTAPIERLREAMGTPDLVRGNMFSVRIDPSSFYDAMSPLWRQRYLMAGDGPNAQLLTPAAGPANTYLVRSNSGGSLKLGAGQFHVEGTMPPPVLP